MDPLGCYSDEQIWSVLELVHLKDRIGALENGLSYILAGDGHNLRFVSQSTSFLYFSHII